MRLCEFTGGGGIIGRATLETEAGKECSLTERGRSCIRYPSPAYRAVGRRLPINYQSILPFSSNFYTHGTVRTYAPGRDAVHATAVSSHGDSHTYLRVRSRTHSSLRAGATPRTRILHRCESRRPAQPIDSYGTTATTAAEATASSASSVARLTRLVTFGSMAREEESVSKMEVIMVARSAISMEIARNMA